MHKIHERVHC